MSAALKLLSVFTLFALTQAADRPLNVVGEGLMSSLPALNPSGKGVRYAGPIVYTNEKPPIIYFPPPPKNAKPGLFGKGKSPKSIKYVPMPHHDLPVLIYTSDKTPPIHMVHSPNEEGPSFSSAPSFRTPKEFGPSFQGPEFSSSFGAPASLSSTYGLPGETSARIVTSSYQIPSTSYGKPVNPYGSPLGSLDLSSGSSNEESVRVQQHVSSNSFGPSQPPVSEHFSSNRKPGYFGFPQESQSNKPHPHIMYSGHPPIHVFNEPDVYVKAPKSRPLKSYEDLPPKASFGPPKSSFGPSSINSFGPSGSYQPLQSSYGQGQSAPQQKQRPSFKIIPARENIQSSASTNNPSSTMSFGSPAPNYNSQQVEAESSSSNFGGPSQNYGGSRPYEASRPYYESSGPSYASPRPNYGGSPYSFGSHTYSFAPQHNSYSLGPFSIEYGPPTEPFMSFSEPAGSLSSLYGQISPSSNHMSASKPDDGWMPGPPPNTNGGGQIKEEVWSGPQSPRPGHGHGPMPGPSPMHSSVYLPSSSPFGSYSSSFAGSKLASLFSSFKLKRSKPKYAIAPKSMHKPPIIIYYGQKPPVHVYQKQEDEITSASSNIQVSSEVPSSLNSESSGNENVQSNRPEENVDLTYGASQTSEYRVAPPASEERVATMSPPKPNIIAAKPAIIAAKPVDIFSSGELQPSIYMARNSLNTIFVSDLSGSGARAIKTYVLRRDEDSDQTQGKLTITQATVLTPTIQLQPEDSASSISNRDGSIAAAEERISVTQPSSPPSISENKEKEDSADGAISPAILLSSVDLESDAAPSEQVAEETQPAPVFVQSPSSFQTSLSKAEKESNPSS